MALVKKYWIVLVLVGIGLFWYTKKNGVPASLAGVNLNWHALSE